MHSAVQTVVQRDSITIFVVIIISEIYWLEWYDRNVVPAVGTLQRLIYICIISACHVELSYHCCCCWKYYIVFTLEALHYVDGSLLTVRQRSTSLLAKGLNSLSDNYTCWIIQQSARREQHAWLCHKAHTICFLVNIMHKSDWLNEWIMWLLRPHSSLCLSFQAFTQVQMATVSLYLVYTFCREAVTCDAI